MKERLINLAAIVGAISVILSPIIYVGKGLAEDLIDETVNGRISKIEDSQDTLKDDFRNTQIRIIKQEAKTNQIDERTVRILEALNQLQHQLNRINQ